MSKIKKFKSKHKYAAVILLNKLEVLPVVDEHIYPITSSFQDKPWHMINLRWRGMSISCDIGSVIFIGDKEHVKTPHDD